MCVCMWNRKLLAGQKTESKSPPIVVLNFLPVYLKHFIRLGPQAKQLA